jgi:CRP/FNR family transcriptional regulator, nitrogen oxide reductase regulator
MMHRRTDLAILAGSELLRGASRAAIEEAQVAAIRRSFAGGEAIFRQDDPASVFYVVVAGRVRVTQTTPDGRQITIRYVGPGETAGYDVLTGAPVHPSTATAIDETHVLGWQREVFRSLMSKHPEVALTVVGVIGERLRQMQTRVRELSTENVERRLARTLLRLAEQAGRRTGEGVEIAFPLSRQDLAEMAGTTLHTASRTLSAWDERGMIDSGRRRVILRSPEDLKAVAEAAR